MNTQNNTHGGGKRTSTTIALLITLVATLLTATTAHASGPPTVTIEKASEITRTSMKICGTVNPNGEETTYHFAYVYVSNEIVFRETTPNASAGQGEAPVEVCTTLTGLPPKTSLGYSLVAVNASATRERIEFTRTLATVDGMKIGAATAVTAHTAVLHGSFEPNGYDTHYYFRCYDGEFVTIPAPPGIDAGSATEVKTVEAEISGIGGNSEVSCVLVASNSFGSEESERVSFRTEKAAPEITTPPIAEHVSASSAVASGRVMTQNETTTYWVEYVEAAKYEPEATNPYAGGAKSVVISLRAENGLDSPVDAPLENLSPQTTYHYRLIAKNGTGETIGTDATVRTGALSAPLASTGEATGVTTTTATISGAVNPQGSPTSYEFQIGTDTTYGGAEIFGDGGEGEGTETVQTTLAYLVPGTTYHYRIAATSKDGTTYGADRTFTTPNVTSPISQPASTPLLSLTPIAFPAEQKAKVVKKKTKKKAKRKTKGKRGKNKRSDKGKRKKK